MGHFINNLISFLMLYCCCTVLTIYLLSLNVQTHKRHKAADLQEEINEDGQTGKHRERPHCGHGREGTYRNNKETEIQLNIQSISTGK